MRDQTSSPVLSVVIPTHNRGTLLGDALASLTQQSLPPNLFEVLVVDDGSTDRTREVCSRFADRLPLRYFHLEHAGIAAAKNIGIFSARGELLFFFDDDDVAHGDLLHQHVQAHERWPHETAAVLGYTTWAPWLEVTELMHFATEVGKYLFAYPGLPAGRPLDFTYFWGGRSSCKRSFLARHGTFRQDFEFGCEDIELGYRLNRFGLTVFYEPRAVSYMNRGITLDEFCRRCERQGRAQFVFSDVHDDPIVQAYCQVEDAAGWPDLAPQVPHALARLRQLEPAEPHTDDVRREMWKLYDFVFKAHKLKGLYETAARRGVPLAASAC